MAKNGTTDTGLMLVTLLLPAADVKELDADSIIHQSRIDLDEPELSSTGNSFKAAYAAVAGNEAPMASVRIEGKVVKVPMAITHNAYFSAKAVEKAGGPKAKRD